MFIFILLLSISISLNLNANPISSPTEFIPQDFDVIQYRANINIHEMEQNSMNGSCTISLQWLNDSNEEIFYFNLRGLGVDSVLINNQIRDYRTNGDENSSTFNYSVLREELDNEFTDIVVHYSGSFTNEGGNSPWGGVHNDGTYLYAMGVGFKNNYVSTTQHWIPCYDHPSDKAKFDLKFIVPSSYTVASIGLLEDETTLDSLSIFHWVSNKQMASYLACFAMSKYKEVHFEPYKEIPISVYANDFDTTAVRFGFQNLNRMVSTYSNHFGEYPFEKVGYVLTPLGAMEHQTMVSFPIQTCRNYLANNDTVGQTVAHELSHHWFGNLVTPKDFRDAWLNEGFATFCEILWYEELLGKEAALQLTRSKGTIFLNLLSKTEGKLSLYDFNRSSRGGNYPNTIYQKGAVVISMLRENMGKEKFNNAINNYLEEYKNSNATSENLKSFISDEYPFANQFFDQWIYGNTIPKLNFEYYFVGDQNYLKVSQVQEEDEIFKDLKVNVQYTSNGKDIELNLILNEKEEIFYIEHLPDGNRFTVNNSSEYYTLFEVDRITSINLLNNSDINIYPNPTNDFIIIENEKNNSMNFELSNLSGDIIKKGVVNNFQKIDLSNLSSGIYFIKLQIENEFIIEKIIINAK